MNEAPPRSWLYVPGTRPDQFAKAVAGPADAIVVDLEDAVPPEAKDAARAGLPALFEQLDEPHPKPIWIRINGASTVWGPGDIDAVAELPCDGVRIPKCEDPASIALVVDRIGRPVQLLIESAVGVENADLLAVSSRWVTGVALGEADLLADLRATDPYALAYSRGRVIIAARAAGLASPVMSVFTAVDDVDGLAADTRAARAAGFFGRSVIHPKQVSVVNDAFTPTPTEVTAAQRLLDSVPGAHSNGLGGFLDEHGRFVDAPVIARAQLVIDLARRVAPNGAEREDS